MEYTNLVRDFAQRTLMNLEAIEAAVENNANAEVFEVTQLVNSMLGLLVFPQQRFFNNIPTTPVEELRRSGWPVPIMMGSPPNADNLRDLMRCLRNGISHCNIEFTSDGKQLTGVRIWNYPPRSRIKNWEALLGLSELRQLARKFIVLLLESNQ